MTELQETVRAKADELATRTKEVWHDTGLDERAAALAAALAAAGAAAGSKIKEAGLDAKAAELAHRLTDSKTAQQAAEIAREYGDRAVDRVSTWLEESGAAERLGFKPARRSRSKWRFVLYGLLAMGAAAAANALRSRRQTWDGSLETAGPVGDVTSTGDAAQAPLADKVRTAIGEDPRTRDLPERLNINVVDGTVFIRGPVPEGFSDSDLRDVVINIDGVTDVDLQVTHSA